MRALIWDGQRLEVDTEVEVREPGENEVAVDIVMAGLCHSDVSPMEGRIPQPTPVILGHEAVGYVAQAGPGAKAPIGGRVGLTVLRRCGICRHCLAGQPNRCRASGAAVPSPFSRRGEVVHQFVRLGAFAERIVVSADQVIPMPAEIPDPVAAMLSCATITAFGAVEDRARLRAGESVLVTGAGGIGLNTVLACRAAGASRIIVVDRNPLKEEVARRCGATDFVLSTDTGTVAEQVLALEPEGVDAAFECAGHVGLLDAAIAALAWGGRVVMLGLAPAGASMEFQPRSLFNDKSVMGCRMGSVDPRVELPRLAARVVAGEFDLTPLVSKIVPMDGAAGLVEELREGRIDRGFMDFRR